MANESSNNKNVADTDDDATVEFEIPGGLRRARPAGEPEIEVDENTYDIDDRDASTRNSSRPELKRELDARKERIGELEFRLAQLESENRGMQEELKAREDIARTLNAEADAARKNLVAAERKLRESREELDALRPALDNVCQRAERLDGDNKQLEVSATELNRQIMSLKQQLEEQDQTICALKAELGEASLAPEPGPAEDSTTIRDLEAALQHSREEVAGLRAYIDGRKAELSKLTVDATRKQEGRDEDSSAALSAALDDARGKLRDVTERLRSEKAKGKELRRENRRLARVLDQEAGQELKRNRDRIDAQSGQITSLQREVAGLREDNARLEEYADSLRIQLQDQIAVSRISVAMRRKLEVALDRADARIAEMTVAREDARRIEDELRSGIAEQKDRHEAEIRQLRFELGAAEETIADQETINEQLASDLGNYREYRQALESQLAETERNSSDSIGALRSKLHSARKELEDLESRLRDKDDAISELMNQLAAHSSAIEIESEPGKRLQPIDGSRRAYGGLSGGDKIARQLIGNVDGRELRFPLFKDRLSIGRTSFNDIQLNMQFVSRRHAVIATDHGATRVIDWGSKNGVYVNRERVTERILKSGDVISIGTSDFRYEEHAKK